MYLVTIPMWADVTLVADSVDDAWEKVKKLPYSDIKEDDVVIGHPISVCEEEES